MSSAQTLVDSIYRRIEHGDDEHKKWLKEELKKIAEDLEKGWFIFDPVQKLQMQDGMKKFRDYANSYIAFQKARSGQFELTDLEKDIEPAVRLAFALLQI